MLADHLADGLVGVEQDAGVVEAGRRALLAGLGVQDLGALGGPTPSEPGGMSGSRLMFAPPSVEP